MFGCGYAWLGLECVNVYIAIYKHLGNCLMISSIMRSFVNIIVSDASEDN